MKVREKLKHSTLVYDTVVAIVASCVFIAVVDTTDHEWRYGAIPA